MKPRIRKLLRWSGLSLLAAFILIQLWPYGRDHSNPPVVAEPAWDTPATARLARAACFDCHSNETVWPWYSWVAPASWLVQSDVEEARRKLNFSEWNRPQRRAKDAPVEVREGEMPMWYYTPLHSAARLSQAEQEALASGLDATLAGSPPGGGAKPAGPAPAAGKSDDDDHEQDGEER